MKMINNTHENSSSQLDSYSNPIISTELMIELEAIFFDQLKEIMPVVEQVYEKKNFDALASHAHKIRSTAQIVNAKGIHLFATEIERAINKEHINYGLITLLQGFKQAVNAYIQSRLTSKKAKSILDN